LTGGIEGADRAVPAVLSVEGLRIERRVGDGTQTIVSRVDLELGAGKTIGIVGESGSGKSMTARAMTGLLPRGLHATGEIRYEGQNLLSLREQQWRSVRGTEIGLILQDPFTMLNPVLRIGRIIGESLRDRRGLSRQAERAEAIRRLSEVGIHEESVVDRYPFQLSGGMRQRVAIAAALARDPRVLIADEPSTALDVTTQRDILALIKQIQAARGMSLILITHDLRVAFSTCDRIYVLYAGSVMEVGAPAGLDAEPLHPYSHGLLLSEPPMDRRVGALVAIPGAVPAPDDVAGCCAFAPRCRWAADSCREGAPALQEVAPGRFSSCLRISAIQADMASIRQLAEQEAPSLPDERPARAPVVSVQEVSKVFKGKQADFSALDGVSLEVRENEGVALVGESGSGKTTLSRLVVGLEKATAGKVVIDGINATDWAKLGRDDLRKLRRTVQIVFQDPYSSLNPMRTIGWTLAEAITTYDPRARNVGAKVGELLDSVGLAATAAQLKPMALSGGMRQRVAIARAIALHPRVLVCDEPVSALDTSVQAQILELFKALRAELGIGYLFITHDLSIVRQVSEYMYVMRRGRIVESGPTDEILDHPRDPYTIKLLDSAPRSEREWLVAEETS
jgi:peptide/nickel transport system ATP-binding protein